MSNIKFLNTGTLLKFEKVYLIDYIYIYLQTTPNQYKMLSHEHAISELQS